MLQRLGLAVAMVPDADILLLDEPTAALDAEGLTALYGLIEERRHAGAAILFSSHQLGDVERLADHIAVLAKGRLVAMMSERELANRLADRGVMRVRLRTAVAGVTERLRGVCRQASWDGDELVIHGPAAGRPEALDVIREAGGEITGLTAEEGRLDELYRELVEASR
jgi:Cu-processing system ATP-binding protein